MKGARTTHQRGGLTLVIVVVVMAVAAGLLSVLVAQNIDMHRRLQQARGRAAARAISASMAQYTSMHRQILSQMRPGEPVTLDVSALAPGRTASEARIEHIARDDGFVFRLTTRLERGRLNLEDIRELSAGHPAVSGASTASTTRPGDD